MIADRFGKRRAAGTRSVSVGIRRTPRPIEQPPVVCVRCLVTACPSAPRRVLQLRRPYLCAAHEAQRRLRPRRAIPAGPAVATVEAITRPRVVAESTLRCPVCGTPVDGHDAVATSGDHVVHAWCHPHFATFWNPARRVALRARSATGR